MDVFQEQGQRFQVRSAFTTGAVFGLFLTIGNAWSVFFKSTSLAFFEWIRPSQDAGSMMVDFITAVITSILCILTLMLLLHAPVWCTRFYRLCPCECSVET